MEEAEALDLVLAVVQVLALVLAVVKVLALVLAVVRVRAMVLAAEGVPAVMVLVLLALTFFIPPSFFSSALLYCRFVNNL